MCGICGHYSNKETDNSIVAKMNKALSHRGPDGEGHFEENGLQMAMRRLSIIDLEGGWQPLFNEDKSLVLMINGEVYNFVELRKILISKGHHFITRTDGEVILHLYEEYGIDCLQYLRGMYAFALWNKKTRKLLIARDRMGEKPLYYFWNDKQFVFSSELHSLMASNIIDFKLNPLTIDMFFHYHYIPEPFTPIEQINKLPAGHYMVLDTEKMDLRLHSYWNMEDAPTIDGNPVEIIKQVLLDTSKLVVRSDVPIGVALSGGIDSALVAALAKDQYGSNMHAFTIGYEGRPETDERNTAFRIANYLEMPFHEIELHDEDFIKDFPRMCSLTDDPIADISAYGYFSVSKTAKEYGVPVLLQGQGGDELFWGYPWLKKNFSYIKLKNDFLNGKAGFFDYYHHEFNEKYNKPTLKKIIKGLSYGFRDAVKIYKKHNHEDPELFPFYDFFPGFNSGYKEMYGNYMLEHYSKENASLQFKIKRPWLYPDVTLTRLISQTYLLENGITQGDRLSMANSVELRLPLVDYKLVETVIGLRKKNPDVELGQKYWLKEVSKEFLPDWLLKMPKRGFEPPVNRWLDGLLKRYGENLIDGNLQKLGILNSDSIKELVKGKISPGIVFPAYFNALVLEFWIESFKVKT